MRRLIIALSVAGLVGCKAQLDDKCGKPEDCAVGLQCGAHFKCFDPSKTPNQPVIYQASAKPQPLPDRQKRTSKVREVEAPSVETTPPKDVVAKEAELEEGRTPGSAKSGEKCGKPEDCSTGLQCGPNFLCFDPAAAECRESARCSTEGLCSAQDGGCAALKSEDCKEAAVCREGGRCAARGGVCVALSDSDCRNAPNCKKLAQCSVRDGKCVPGSTADCRGSDLCKLEGTCTLVGKVCAAGSTADCTDHSESCRKEGRCDAIDGLCVFANPEPE